MTIKMQNFTKVDIFVGFTHQLLENMCNFTLPGEYHNLFINGRFKLID